MLKVIKGVLKCNETSSWSLFFNSSTLFKILNSVIFLPKFVKLINYKKSKIFTVPLVNLFLLYK